MSREVSVLFGGYDDVRCDEDIKARKDYTNKVRVMKRASDQQKISSGRRTADAVDFIKASPMMQPRNTSSNGSCGMEDTASLASKVLRRASAGR